MAKSKSKASPVPVEVVQPTPEVLEAPVKSTSSYMLFCKEERPNVKVELPDLNNKQIIVELARRWKDLKLSDVKRFESLNSQAKADQERYKQEKDNFSKEAKSAFVVEAKEEPKEETKQKKPKKQKETKPVVEEEKKKTKVNGYINFMSKNREAVKTKNPKLTPQEIMSELARQWKALSDSEKNTYK